MTMGKLPILLLFGFAFVQHSTTRECYPKDEIPCRSGECVKNEVWCDGEYDCRDGSDEYYCEARPCEEYYFQCENGRCIPKFAVCNSYDNCGDGSDEICNGTPHFNQSSHLAKEAVAKAANYLLSKRNPDYGWDSFTSRAMVALAFAEQVYEIPEQEKALMKKHLNVQILLSLMRYQKRTNLIELAFHVNALYATCQNPRYFNEMDLVDLLRSETENKMKVDFNLPFVLMTLCIADERNSSYLSQLFTMYDDGMNNQLSFKALTIMAMTACRSGATHSEAKKMQKRMEKFREMLIPRSSLTEDIYTSALVYQALKAMKVRDWEHDLWTRQHADGSFGDLLSTYYAIPVLLNTSLLNLKCNRQKYDDKSLRMSSNYIEGPENKTPRSVWITQNTDVDSHTMLITLEGKKSLYDAMMIAKSRDPRFGFMCDETRYGRVVYCMRGLPNDAETGMSWTLYRGNGSTYVESPKHLQKETRGIETIFPEDGSHFIFWRKLI